MVEVSLTVGKLDASLALLLTKDHHLIEFPTILLPNGVRAGLIVKIRCDQDHDSEIEEARKFQGIQDEILNTFGKNLPKTPVLKIKNVTQTSCVLEWDQLDLGTANLKNLILFKDGKKLGAIPQPLTNKTTKLSGLPIDKTFQFQLRLDTSAGVYSSDVVEVTTHKMTDLSGITVCLGDIQGSNQFSVDDIEQALKNMGAKHPAQKTVQVDTTHFICTRENKDDPEYLKASDMNIPIIRPEWLKACERERRIVGVRDFYVKDCALHDIISRDYWGVSSATVGAEAQATASTETQPEPVTNDSESKEVEPKTPPAPTEPETQEETPETEPAEPVEAESQEKEVPESPRRDSTDEPTDLAASPPARSPSPGVAAKLTTASDPLETEAEPVPSLAEPAPTSETETDLSTAKELAEERVLAGAKDDAAAVEKLEQTSGDLASQRDLVQEDPEILEGTETRKVPQASPASLQEQILAITEETKNEGLNNTHSAKSDVAEITDNVDDAEEAPTNVAEETQIEAHDSSPAKLKKKKNKNKKKK